MSLAIMAHIRNTINICKTEKYLWYVRNNCKLKPRGWRATGVLGIFWGGVKKKRICHVINQNNHLELRTILNDKRKQRCLHKPKLQLVKCTTVHIAQSKTPRI